MGCYSKFARCCAVVVDVFPKIMQQILATRIQAADLYDTVMNHTDFKKRLSGDEINTIQTLVTDGFSKFNVTLIYKIAKFFNFIPSPTQNWGANPSANEVEIGDDVERIRLTRKNLVHRIDCEIGDLEFHTLFSDLEQHGNRVDVYLKKSNDFGFQKDIEYRKTITIDDCQEDEYIESIKGAEELREGLKRITQKKREKTQKQDPNTLKDKSQIRSMHYNHTMLHDKKKLLFYWLDGISEFVFFMSITMSSLITKFKCFH